MQTEITIKRPVTIILLLAVTVLIVMTTVWMSGKSYAKVDPLPFEISATSRTASRVIRCRRTSSR